MANVRRDSTSTIGARVVGLAIRPASGVPMREVSEAFAESGGWLRGDHGGSAKRGLTLLSREIWNTVNARLGSDLPWHVRRANICVEGIDLMAARGRILRVGGLVVHVGGETRPCEEMDKAHDGLQRVLETRGWGGVYGRIVRGGNVRVGDVVEVPSVEGRDPT